MGEAGRPRIGLNRAATLAAVLSLMAFACVVLFGRNVVAAATIVPAWTIVLKLERHLHRSVDGSGQAALAYVVRLGAKVGLAMWAFLGLCALVLMVLHVPGADDGLPGGIAEVTLSAIVTTAATALCGGAVAALHMLLGGDTRQPSLPPAILLALAGVCVLAIFLVPQFPKQTRSVHNQAYLAQ